MNSPESVTKPITFQWMPTPYPVKWADSSEEVPEWDVSRGFPLSVGMHSALGAAAEANNELEVLRLLLRNGHVGYKDSASTWEPLPSPDKDYPRLVRASLNVHTYGEQRHEYPVLTDLARLHRYIPAWRQGKDTAVLRREVLRLSSLYGMASREGNTLTAWLKLSAEVVLHKRLYRALSTGGFEGLDGEWSTAYTSLTDREEVDAEEYKRRRRKADEAPRDPRRPFLSAVAATPILSNLDAIERHELSYLQGVSSWVGKENTKSAVKQALSYGLYDAFGMTFHVRGDESTKLLHQHWGVRAYCDLSIWVNFALSEMWRGNKSMQQCEGCGTLYVPVRSGTKYCRRTCAVKAYRRK